MELVQEQPLADLHYYLNQWKQYVLQIKITRQNQIKAFTALQDRKNKMAKKVIEFLRSHKEQKQQENREKYFMAQDYHLRQLFKKTCFGFKKYCLITDNFQTKITLMYSKYLKKKYFEQIKKFKLLGIKTLEKKVEMQIVKNNNKIMRECLHGWLQSIRDKNNFIMMIDNVFKSALMRQSLRCIKSFGKEVVMPNRQRFLPPRPPNADTQMKTIIDDSEQKLTLNFQRKYAPVKTIPYKSSNTPEKRNNSRQSLSQLYKTARQAQKSQQKYRHTERYKYQETQSEKQKQVGRLVVELNNLLYVKRVEFQFFNDPIFNQQKYLKYQEKVKIQIIQLHDQIQFLMKRQIL